MSIKSLALDLVVTSWCGLTVENSVFINRSHNALMFGKFTLFGSNETANGHHSENQCFELDSQNGYFLQKKSTSIS